MSDPAFSLEKDPASIWSEITGKLREELPRQSYLTWFRPLDAVAFDGKVLTLNIPSQFYYDWIVSHYRDPLQRAIDASVGDGIEITYQIDSSCRNRLRDPLPIPKRRSAMQGQAETFVTHLNQKFDFENFVEGDCNRFARAAALSLAKSPGMTTFNPLMIYGGPGLGKTHLIQAIGNYIVEEKLAERVLYVTSEQFTTDFIKAIQSHRAEQFSRIYRNVDVLLLDDVQFFMAKGKTQEEFFHTFNTLQLAGKQLVFSSDRSPRDLEGFDERLVSRLQWGLVSELTAPEYETRVVIIMNRANEEDIDLPEEVAHFLATHITENVRILQGALTNMFARSSLVGREISIELAKEAILGIGNRISPNISVERIQEMVAAESGIPSDLLRSKTRKKEIVRARQIAMYFATELTRLTLKAIGLHFGGRDHATVIHARESINELIKTNRSDALMIKKMRQRLELESM